MVRHHPITILTSSDGYTNHDVGFYVYAFSITILDVIEIPYGEYTEKGTIVWSDTMNKFKRSSDYIIFLADK